MFSPQIHRYIFLFGVCSLGFGIMMGPAPTSIPQIILLANWLLEMDFKRKWSDLKSNTVFWVVISIFLVHILGLIHSSDTSAGMADLWIKMPIFFLALIFFSTKPLQLKEFYFLLYCFIAACFVNTAWCMVYSFVLHKNELVRSASRFMSHIRLGLYLNVCICACAYLATRHASLIKKAGFVLLGIYFLFSMYALGLASGLGNFAIVCLLALCYAVYKQNIKIKILAVALAASGIFFMAYYVSTIYSLQFTIVESPANNKLEKSVNGRLYYHFENATQLENGYYVHRNVQLEELKEWNKRCPQDSFAYTDNINYEKIQVLMRYLSSKGLLKDSAGIWSLSQEDLGNVQNNITNYRYPQWSYFHKRVYELVNEYDEFKHGRNVNGHSLAMRIHFWKTALYIINNNLVIGVGTGDVQSELNAAYETTKAPLEKEWFKRPHNQFLTITVALGIIGLLIFLFSIFAPVLWLRKYLHLLYWPFFAMAVISFLIEDTLESQAGLTFFAFFNILFLSMAFFARKDAEIK